MLLSKINEKRSSLFADFAKNCLIESLFCCQKTKEAIEILKEPTSENCIFALIYRIEYENFTDILDLKTDKVEIISKRIFTILDGWIRESLSELINNVLSLPDGSEKDQAKRVLKQRMESLYDRNLKSHLYSVCRSLKILT